MCVICVKPKGVEMPSNEIIKAMYKANHDGCGFCTPTKDYKGLSLDSFLREIAKVTADEPCIMHFRWATHGSVKLANCHPFYAPEVDLWFAHNGVLDIRPKGDMTDSETAFRQIIAPIVEKCGLDSEDTVKAINSVRECSRFALMQGDQVRIYGQFYERFGCYYSNLNFVHLIYEDRIHRHNLTSYGNRI